MLYPQWHKMVEWNGRISDNQDKMENTGVGQGANNMNSSNDGKKHYDTRQAALIETALTELIRMYNDYTKISKTHAGDNQLIGQYYQAYKSLEEPFKELIQGLKDTNYAPEVIMTRDKFYEWIKTRDDNEGLIEKGQNERKQK